MARWWRREGAPHYDYFKEDDYMLHFPPRRAYYAYGPFRLITLVMIAALFVFAAAGLLCLLGYVAELAEENPSCARTVLRVLIVCNIVVHVAILTIDQLSWWRSCISIAVNALYWCLMRSFPFVPALHSPLAVCALVLMVAESVAWYWLSLSLLHYTSTWAVFGFFVMLWLVPVGLFASCILPDECLPGGGVPVMPAGSSNAAAATAGGAHRAYLPGGHDVSARRPRTLLGRVVQFVRDPTA